MPWSNTIRSLVSTRALFALCIAMVTTALASPAAAVPLFNTFGGPAGFGRGVLPANDDGSSEAIDLTGAFSGGLRFYGGPYTEFWVNNNGSITFAGPEYTYTPIAFPIASRPMIAPYWGDVDTRARSGLSSSTENLVYWHLEPGRLIVTWYQVGYFSSHNDLRMNFQLILSNATGCGSGDFDVEFRYDVCEWVTGDASGGSGGHGGTPAQAGFDAGNLTDFIALPGSFTEDIVNLCETTNVEGFGEFPEPTPGLWRFSVRAGAVVCREDMICLIPSAVGPCAIGRTQCVDNTPVCQPITTPVDELCDGVDNDCNGTPDDAPGLCGSELTCQLGQCVPPCFEGACIEGYMCEAELGACVETACVDVDCPSANQRCEAGECVDACLGIVCPFGEQCISGVCVDPCRSVECDEGRLCRGGICVLRCPCSPCPLGETCMADGSCEPYGCDIVTCGEGQYCQNSTCHDACEGVVCPRGQECDVGHCVIARPHPPEDAGMPPSDAGLGSDSGVFPEDAGADGGDAGDAGTPREPSPPAREGCGCRVAGAPVSMGPWFFVAAFGALAFVRSRRRKRA